MFRINRMLDREFELPVKTLELNPRHPLIHNLSAMIANAPGNPLIDAVVAQVFETALLQDGIHPDPAAMAQQLYLIMQAATASAVSAEGVANVTEPAPSSDTLTGDVEVENAEETDGE
jgi:molecular chaperone HtpG